MIAPTIGAESPPSPSPKPNFRPHRPRMKLPSPELAMVMSRKTGLRFGLLADLHAQNPPYRQSF